MRAGEFYYRLKYLNAEQAKLAVNSIQSNKLSTALQEIDQNSEYFDGNLNNKKFLLNAASALYKPGVRSRVCSKEYHAYAVLDGTLYRIYFYRDYIDKADTAEVLRELIIKGEIRRIPAICDDDDNIEMLLLSLTSRNTIVTAVWEVLFFTRYGDGIINLDNCNAYNDGYAKQQLIGPAFASRPRILDLFHGFTVNYLAPYIFYATEYSNENLECYGYKFSDQLFEEMENETIDLANSKGIYFISGIPHRDIVEIEDEFLHSSCGEVAEIINQEDVPASWWCRVMNILY